MTLLERKNKLLFCLTPMHVGEEGMRLGHVDNIILREASSQEPVIPGTTMLGNYSQFVYLWACSHNPDFVKRELKNIKNYGTEKNPREMTLYQLLFGLDRTQKETPESQIHEKGIRLDSAKILWIPCMTLKGPKLVASKERFERIFSISLPDFGEEEILTTQENLFNDKILQVAKTDIFWLNLKNIKVTATTFLNNNTINSIETALPHDLKNKNKKITEDIVFVKESLFPYIISKSLKIRTSVSIDRVTRAAKDKALFTYELLPRNTLLSFGITVSKTVAEQYSPPTNDILKQSASSGVWEILEKVRPYFEMVGIGGMTSRGFGKCKILDLKQ